MDIDDVERGVERAFRDTALGLRRWDDPHPSPERIVADEEYSRLTDPGKWRILNARVEAWVAAVVGLGVAWVEPVDPDESDAIDWVVPPGTAVTRTDLVRPSVDGGLVLVWCRSRMGDVDGAGVTLGVARPDGRALVVDRFPDCGCDACDSGSQADLDVVDEHVRAIVTGTFRLLERRHQRIMRIDPPHWSASNLGGFRGPSGRRRPIQERVDAVLADPVGWEEWFGPSWLHGEPVRLGI